MKVVRVVVVEEVLVVVRVLLVVVVAWVVGALSYSFLWVSLGFVFCH